MKLCINCAHFKADANGLPAAEWGRCAAFHMLPHPNPVDGSDGPPRYCKNARLDGNQCGPDALAFVAITEQAAA